VIHAVGCPETAMAVNHAYNISHVKYVINDDIDEKCYI
jgi:hypothetical protein